jgi:hypothetical protein
MPLHGQHKMIRVGAFNGFDDAVVGAACHDSQILAHNIGRLMMAGVHRHAGGIGAHFLHNSFQV